MKALKFSGVQPGFHTWYENAEWREDPAFPSFETVLKGLEGMPPTNVVEKARTLGVPNPRALSEAKLREIIASKLGYDHSGQWFGPVVRINPGDVIPRKNFHVPGKRGWPKEGLDVAANFLVRGLAEEVEMDDPSAKKRAPKK